MLHHIEFRVRAEDARPGMTMKRNESSIGTAFYEPRSLLRAALVRRGGYCMKKLLMIVAAASLGATVATAQTTVTTTTTGTGNAAVQIEPQYRTKIKSYVTEHKVRPITTKERIVVGSRVPADVELDAVPADWGPSLTKYRYVYSNDRVMLVDPGSRTVVQEID
jgi:hypothetical protein